MRQSWGPHSLVPMKSCKADLLGQDMSLDELIEKDYLPPKVRTVNLGAMLNFEICGHVRMEGKQHTSEALCNAHSDRPDISGQRKRLVP